MHSSHINRLPRPSHQPTHQHSPRLILYDMPNSVDAYGEDNNHSNDDAEDNDDIDDVTEHHEDQYGHSVSNRQNE